MKVLSIETGHLPEQGKLEYTRQELREMREFIGPTGKLLAKTALKQEGHKLLVTEKQEDDPATLEERLAQIIIAQVRSNRAFRVKEARELGYDVVVHSASGTVGSAR